MSKASLTLAVNPDGNWSLTPDDVPNDFPPIALPASSFPPGDPALAREYAVALLRANDVASPERLPWQEIGHTEVNGTWYAAYRATWEA